MVLAQNAKNIIRHSKDKRRNITTNRTEKKLLKNVMNTQLQFFGHVMRKQKLEHVVICGKIRGKRARGRQRLKFMDQLKDVLGGSTEEILRAVNDRDGWRNKCREAVEGWPQP